MLAIGVLVAAGLLLGQWVFETGLRIAGFEKGRAQEQITQMRSRLAQLEQDMSMAVNRPVRDSGDLPQPALVGNPQAFGANEAQLSFSRMGMAWQTGVLADVQRHGYRLNNGTLEQLVWPVLDQAPRSEPTVHALLERVNRFELRYLDSIGNWQPRWPLPGVAVALPAALEVVVELDGGVTVTRVFALP
jgi:general secretion pathway protein J